MSRCLTAKSGKVLVRWHRKLLRAVELALAREAIEQRRDRVRPVAAIDEIADRFRQHENRDRQQDQRQHAAENEEPLPAEARNKSRAEPAGSARAQGKAEEHDRHGRRADAPWRVFGRQRDRIRHQAADADAGEEAQHP